MNLDTRQKIIIMVIILALAILTWQVYDLANPSMSVSSTSKDTAGVPATASANMIKPATSYPSPAAVVSGDPAASTAQPQPVATVSPISPADPNAAVDQQKYMALVTQYQMAQIQRMIAEDNEAIAVAKYNAAQALSKIGQLTGDGSSVSSSLNSATDSTDNGDYELIYTGEENGEWTATVKKNGQFNDVTAGSTLPDGSKVLAVDNNGITLQQGDVKKLVTFNGVTPLSGSAPSAPSSNANNSTSVNNTAVSDNTETMTTNPNAAVTAVPVEPTKPAKVKSTAAVTPATPVAATTNNTSAQPKITAAPSNNVASTTSTTNTTNSTSSNVKPKSTNIAINTTANMINPNKAVQTIKTVNAPGNTAVMAKPTTKNNAVTTATAPAAAAATTQATPTPIALKKPAANLEAMVSASPTISTSNNSNNANHPQNSNAVVSSTNENTAEALSAENPNFYTVQIVADDRFNAVNNFIVSHQLQGKATALTTHRNGKPWFIAIYGQYPSVAAATAAIDQLPKSIRAWHPFVRHIRDVQATAVQPQP